MTNNPELEGLRREIDDVDEDILGLLKKRSDIVSRISEVKRQGGLEAHQPDRFNQLMGNLQLRASELEVDPELVVEVWTDIHKSSVRQQQQDLSE